MRFLIAMVALSAVAADALALDAAPQPLVAFIRANSAAVEAAPTVTALEEAQRLEETLAMYSEKLRVLYEKIKPFADQDVHFLAKSPNTNDELLSGHFPWFKIAVGVNKAANYLDNLGKLLRYPVVSNQQIAVPISAEDELFTASHPAIRQLYSHDEFPFVERSFYPSDDAVFRTFPIRVPIPRPRPPHSFVAV